MIRINLTRPGFAPVDGDLVKIIYPGGSTEEKRYWTPPVAVDPRRGIIIARLGEIDSLSDKPRVRRELALNNVTTRAWLQNLDDEARALRIELSSIA